MAKLRAHCCFGVGLSGLVLLSACSESATNGAQFKRYESGDESAAHFEPQYGSAGLMAGKALFGQETSVIALCETEREDCGLPKKSGQLCWLEITSAGADSLSKLIGRRFVEDGEYWIEGRGRIAVRPGGFGHMSAYACQVELSHIGAFEEGPPWIWTPPPELLEHEPDQQ